MDPDVLIVPALIAAAWVVWVVAHGRTAARRRRMHQETRDAPVEAGQVWRYPCMSHTVELCIDGFMQDAHGNLIIRAVERCSATRWCVRVNIPQSNWKAFCRSRGLYLVSSHNTIPHDHP